MNFWSSFAAVALALASPSWVLAQASAPVTAPPSNYGEMRGLTNYSQQRDQMGARRERVVGNPMEIVEAGRLITQAGATCEAVDARTISHGRAGDTYEVACKDELGWVVTARDGKFSTFDCVALEAAAKASLDPRAKPATCKLPMNLRQEPGLQSLAKRAGVTSCEVDKGAYLGSGGTPPISRYEVHCKAGGGYLIDAPTPGSKAALAITDCAKAAEMGGACSLKR